MKQLKKKGGGYILLIALAVTTPIHLSQENQLRLYQVSSLKLYDLKCLKENIRAGISLRDAVRACQFLRA